MPAPGDRGGLAIDLGRAFVDMIEHRLYGWGIARRLAHSFRGCGLQVLALARFGLDIADRFFERLTLALDFRLGRRRIARPGPGGQRASRAVIESAASIGGVVLDILDRTRDQRIVAAPGGIFPDQCFVFACHKRPPRRLPKTQNLTHLH